MQALWGLLKWILFRFDAESIHDFIHRVLRFLGARDWGRATVALVSDSRKSLPAPVSQSRVGDMIFRNPVGLAAGFDKNGELLRILPSLGFGFAEVGTVTPLPQPGNPRPRLFRDPAKGNLFNCMGFNGQGAIQVARNVYEARSSGILPLNFRVGINLGKNKATSLEDAARDYARAAEPFPHLADYLVINVSSPNTPGLRALQTVESLQRIVGQVGEVIGRWEKRPPLFLKLAPELDDAALAELIPALEKSGVDGWILTNTWGGEWREGVTTPLSGGWSGKILTETSFLRLKAARSLTSKPLISVGGIDSPAEAQRRRGAGATLIQVYTGWIFEGPTLVSRIARSLK